jgi:MFS superfamily sulfate permease-like transporter
VSDGEVKDPSEVSLVQRLKYFCTPSDGRFEDLAKGGSLGANILKDFTAGLIVAMVAIPLAMGMAMASGLKPEQGIVGGAVAGLVGALFGGSKYQVYGPTAAFIPVIGAIMAKYGYNFLVIASILSGIVLLLLGVFRAGRIISRVPNSIVVGFTIGIAITIAMSQADQALGLHAKLGYSVWAKLKGIVANFHEFNVYALILALLTFGITKGVLKLSKYAPAPLIGVGVATLIASTVWADKGLVLIKDKYGAIPTNLLQFSPPTAITMDVATLGSLLYFVLAIVFVSGVESLLCSRMADRLAGNTGTPFNPSKELWGQGWVQILVPLLNGFPHTGALARTATNIKVGALSPLAGVFKFILKLLLAVFLAKLLEKVPMACIAGILLYVAVNMVKGEEIKEVMAHNRFHVALMIFTAIMVPATDFLVGVLSALVLYAVLHKFLDKPAPAPVS